MASKKSYWGYAIIFVFVFFAGLMVSFAVIASRHKSALVVSDYYKAELAYQGRIEKMKNFNSLAEKPVLFYDSVNHKVVLSWPEYFKGKELAGTIYCYKPNASDDDFTINNLSFVTGVNVISDKRLVHGRWTIKLEWASDNVEYYMEKSIKIK